MPTNKKTILVRAPDGSYFEMDKDKFNKDVAYMKKMSKNIRKYGHVGALDPSYRRSKRTVNFAKAFCIVSGIILALIIIATIMLINMN